jgi:tetratricopeptide (TPR) repeat protein
LKSSILIVTLSAMLSVCAGLSNAQTPEAQPKKEGVAPTKTDAVQNGDSTTEAVPGKKGTGDVLPEVVLTRDILFRLLSADLAYQRGQWKTAYGITIRVAKQTRDPRIARRAAEIAISAKQPTEAMAAIRLWHELAPHSEEATKYYLGFTLIGDDLQEAKPILAERLKDASPQARGVQMFQIQRLLSGTKDKAKAFALLEELLTPYAGTHEAHVALAQGAFNMGDRTRAIVEAKKALELKPDSELAVLTLAQASENDEQAMKSLAAFIEVYPKSREVRLAYARLLVNQKKYELARKEFESLLELQPKDATLLYSLGILSVQAKDARNAERYLVSYLDALENQQSGEREPEQVILLLAQLADERGDTEAALKWLAKIEPQSGRNAFYISAQIKSAQISAKRGNLGEARGKLARIETEDAAELEQIILAESQIMRDADQPKEAFAILEAGLKRFPKNASLLYDYAMAAEKLDKLVIMETTLRQLIALDPESQHAYNALGYSLADRNLRLAEAYQLIEKALKLAPNDAFIMDSMGWVQFRLGKFKEAEDWLRRSYEKRQEAEIAAHLGEVLWVTGRKDEAKKIWREGGVKDPKNDTLKSTLKRLNDKP